METHLDLLLAVVLDNIIRTYFPVPLEDAQQLSGAGCPRPAVCLMPSAMVNLTTLTPF